MSLPQSCKVAVFKEVGSSLDVADIEIPTLKPGETLVRIIASTICGSDLHTFSGRRSSPMPTVLGHEIIGTIVAKSNNDGTKLPVGSRVTWSIAASCGACPRCTDNLPQKCNGLFKYGHELFEDAPLSGGLAEYCILRAGTAVVQLPDALPDEVASPANCSTATVAAAFRAAGNVARKKVLITGAGMLGLTAAAYAQVAGASEVVVCDPDPDRLQRAQQFGATRLVEELPDERFDRGIELSGNATAVGQLIESMDIGGTAVLVGSVSPSATVAIDPEQIVRRLITIRGIHNYRPQDLEQAVEFLSKHHHKFPFKDLIQKTFALQDAQAALEYAELQRPVRVCVRP